ncbi:pectin lyase fold/virulence factor [Coniella lustricola]|uniref:Pectin lyase fold/virulence factor n=1 Tax=Coniella lustricola TaxID=2025994 RepID=A0A2T3AIJ3_9PEZI|nr:pectin lyase fold/virulence factor [Coniella lustricola]
MRSSLVAAALQVPIALASSGVPVPGNGLGSNNTCIVRPAPNGADSAPAILAAFQQCGHNAGHDSGSRGTVVFLNETYTISSVMNTTNLRNVDIDHRGTLLWDNSDIGYWLNHSLPVGYQNQSSAWLFGGAGVRWKGHGYGTLDGDGQVWYDFVNGTNNYPRRPHQITITGTKDGVFEGLRFVQSQMWTMTIIHSEDILLDDIYINSTDTEHAVGFDFSSLNTDGADTVYVNNITFRNWVVDNGDDSISMKANSTNILIEDCDFYTGLGIAIGSIGQYDGVFETIENVTIRNITINNGMRYGAYIKTWTGNSTGYPPNGGGGGLGYAANITLQDFHLHNASGVFAITQCTSYNSATGNCDTSEFNIRDLTLRSWTGTVSSDVVAELQCSAAAPCTHVVIEDIDLVDVVNGTAPSNYLCDSVEEQVGFNCTGAPWGENSR